MSTSNLILADMTGARAPRRWSTLRHAALAALVAAAGLASVAAPAAASPAPLSVWAEAGYLDSGLGEVDRSMSDGDFGPPAVRASARAWKPYNEALNSWARDSDFHAAPCGAPPLTPECGTQSYFNVYGDLGTLRGYARTEHRSEYGVPQLGQTYFQAGGSMFDWITPGTGDSLVFRVRLDSTHHVDQDKPEVELGQTQFWYTITLRQAPQPGCPGCDDLIASFTYAAFADTLNGIDHSYGVDANGGFQVSSAVLGGGGTQRTGSFELVLPNPGATFSMSVGGGVMAACDLFDNGVFQGNDCLAWVGAHQSAYLEIVGDYSSSHGFTYIGLPPVPEPATTAMWLAGLGVMGLLARRRRFV